MKKNLVWAIAGVACVLAFACGIMEKRISELNQKVEALENHRIAQKDLLATYKDKLQLADTAIVVFDSQLSERLREKSISNEDAADLLDAMARTWKLTK